MNLLSHLRTCLLQGFVPALAFLALCPSLHATERHFAFTYETATAAKGTVEFENWVTWNNTRGRDRFDFRHELEIGITDRFQLAIYMADWTVPDNGSARYTDSAIELMYNLSNPVTDIVGSTLYGEFRAGPDFIELEGKLILQKNFGPWIIAYNATIEAAWEGSDLHERTGEFQQTLGVAYQVNPHFSIGAEFLHEIEFPDWGEAEPQRVYAGPNASVRFGRWYATVTPLIQLTSLKSEPDVQTRLIFGFEF